MVTITHTHADGTLKNTTRPGKRPRQPHQSTSALRSRAGAYDPPLLH